MELNFIIFPTPKSTYKAGDLKELIQIPFYDDLFRFEPSSPKTRANFTPLIPFNPKDEVPHDSSLVSVYDDKTEEVVQKKLPQIDQTYQTVQLKSSSSTPTISQRTSISPRFFESYRCSRYIPCLYLRSPTYTKKTIIYFHANCEDLRSSYTLIDFLRLYLKMNVLSVEYPGYGIYQGSPSEEAICKDAEYIYKYMSQHSKIGENNLIIMGRSIGTGVACHIAAKFKPLMLILISPFLSLQEVVGERYPMLRNFIKERFNNKLKMPQIQCPTYILHGMADVAISVEQSRQLFELCDAPCVLRTPKEMTHTRFQFESDLGMPLLSFMRSMKIKF